MARRKKVNLNIKFDGDLVVCAKCPKHCKGCKDRNICENMDLYYYVYENIRDTMKARSYKRGKHGAIVEKT